MDDAVSAVVRAANELLSSKNRIIIAVEGRCAAGKSTLAAAVAERLDAVLIHIDDFFLRLEQRTPERYQTAGENIDHERFLKEVLSPLKSGESFCYRPFDCHSGTFKEKIAVMPKSVAIIEGSYCCHSQLRPFYDLKVFVDADISTRLERIERRDGPKAAKIFAERWIPLEEKYFSLCRPQDICELYFKT